MTHDIIIPYKHIHFEVKNEISSRCVINAINILMMIQRFLRQSKGRGNMDMYPKVHKAMYYMKAVDQSRRSTSAEESQLKICRLTDKQVGKLRGNEFLNDYKITQDQLKVRVHLFYQLIHIGSNTFSLKKKTIQLTMRVFDYYCYTNMQSYTKKSKSNRRLELQGCGTITYLENVDEGRLLLTACLYMSAKYNEIYPPNLNDIVYFGDEKFSKAQILKKQVEIAIFAIQCFQISSISDWLLQLFDLPLSMSTLEIYAQSTIFNAENFAIAFAFANFKDHAEPSSRTSLQLRRFRDILQDIQIYKLKIYQNDK